jgi:ATP-binding cassette, subfamily B, bacterial MsbA
MDLNNSLVGVRVLYEVLDSPVGEPDDNDHPPLQVSAGRVEFADVRFAYRAGTPVLRGASFVAQPGKLTALVGASGGGKSTMLSLLLRLDEIERGRILIDGQDIAGVSRASLRRQIAYVGQVVQLFRGTIRENIALGRLGASEEEIVAAAKAAHAHEFVMGFPAGYDTSVGEHGMQLSGGQRQRIAIARALIKNAPIILLDEATAALDSESERHVQEAVAHLRKGRTTLVVAHRLSTIMDADCILVVENGAVVEAGRHDELLRKGGRYASFYRLQLKEQETPRAPLAVG